MKAAQTRGGVCLPQGKPMAFLSCLSAGGRIGGCRRHSVRSSFSVPFHILSQGKSREKWQHGESWQHGGSALHGGNAHHGGGASSPTSRSTEYRMFQNKPTYLFSQQPVLPTPYQRTSAAMLNLAFRYHEHPHCRIPTINVAAECC